MKFPKIKPNDPCACGSGKKAKKCCYRAVNGKTLSAEDLDIEQTFDNWVSTSPFRLDRPLYVARFTADAGFAIPINDRPQRFLHLHGRPAHLRFSTSWTLRNGIAQPGLLHVTALCTAGDLPAAARFLENRVSVALYPIVVAMNAWCAPVREYAVAELTQGLARRKMRRSPRQQEPENARAVRRLDNELAGAFTLALWSSPHVDHLQYAVQHYVQAMDHFRTGAAPMCLEHLFIAVEAMKPVVLVRHRELTGWSDNDYVKKWSLENKNQILPTSRLRLIFDNDKSTYDGACKASNSMEHGNTTYAELWNVAERHYVLAARYVRRSIILACDLNPLTNAKLLGRRYDTPLSDLDHHIDQSMSIEASRAEIISGRCRQLHAARRIATRSWFDNGRDVFDFEYGWESAAPEDEWIM